MKSLLVLITVAMLVACGKKEEPVATPAPAVVDTAAAPAPNAVPAEEAKK